METIVSDIEGTVCPISFVHDVSFPYASKKCQDEIPLSKFPLDAQRSEIESYLAAFPREYSANSDTLLGHIEDLIKKDVKASYLKSLQGYLWKSGYESGEIKAPVYDDAVVAMKNWSRLTNIYIYSSGSVPAQKSSFKHTTYGDLTQYIAGYFDTVNGGPKTEPKSYTHIAAQIGRHKFRFFSDNPKEIDAAHASHWKTTFVIRPGNPSFPDYKWPDEQATEFSPEIDGDN